MTVLDKFMQALRQAGAAGMTVRDIEEALYADRADGGPDVRNCIRVMTYNLRKRGVSVERVTVYRVKPRR